MSGSDGCVDLAQRLHDPDDDENDRENDLSHPVREDHIPKFFHLTQEFRHVTDDTDHQEPGRNACSAADHDPEQ